MMRTPDIMNGIISLIFLLTLYSFFINTAILYYTLCTVTPNMEVLLRMILAENKYVLSQQESLLLMMTQEDEFLV